MTNLVEHIRVDITLHRDEQDNFPFDNLLPWSRDLPPKGMVRKSGITVEWEKLGCVEVPEVGGSDN